MRELKHLTSASMDEGIRDCMDEHGPAIYGYFWLCLELIGAELGRNKQHPVIRIKTSKLEEYTGTPMNTGIKYLLCLQQKGLLSFNFEDDNKDTISLVCLKLLKYNHKQIISDLYEETQIDENENSSIANILQSLLDLFSTSTIAKSGGQLADLDALLPSGQVVNITDLFNTSSGKFVGLVGDMEGDTDSAMYFYFLYSLKFLLNIYKQMGNQWRFKQLTLGKYERDITPKKELPTSSMGSYGYGTGMIQAPMQTDEIVDPEFEEFWGIYPKKIAKKKAQDAWNLLRNKNGLPEHKKLMTILGLHVKSVSWNQEGGKYVPYPYNWLVDGRWNDDIAALNRAGNLREKVGQIKVGISCTTPDPLMGDAFDDYLEVEKKREELLKKRLTTQG